MWFIFGLITGCFIGITIMAVLSVAREDERQNVGDASAGGKVGFNPPPKSVPPGPPGSSLKRFDFIEINEKENE